ncbi:MAG: hypothetical protein OEP52_07160 [Acidimicrobiia bacterium]|jgi:hypothetical protein|nr:hypothetical protein [Acidimicrobiia bacterium]
MIDLVAAQVDNAWWYVTVAYIVILGGMAAFVAWLGFRTRRARRELEQLS